MAEHTATSGATGTSISVSWPMPPEVQLQIPLKEPLVLHRPSEQEGQAGALELTLHNLQGAQALFLQASARAVEVLLAQGVPAAGNSFSYSTTVRLQPAVQGAPGLYEGTVPFGRAGVRGVRLRLASLVGKQVCTISQLRLERPKEVADSSPSEGSTGQHRQPPRTGNNDLAAEPGHLATPEKDRQGTASTSSVGDHPLLSQAEQMRLLLRVAAAGGGGSREGDAGPSIAEGLPPSLQALAERVSANTRGPAGNILKAMAQSALAMQGQGIVDSLMKGPSLPGAGSGSSSMTSRDQAESATSNLSDQPHSQATPSAPAADVSFQPLLQAVLSMGQAMQGQLASLQAAVQKLDARVQRLDERLQGVEELIRSRSSC